MNYYFSKISKNNFEDTLQKIDTELKKVGFGILTEIDVQDTLKKKLDVEFRKYKILGACNPQIAYQVLSNEDKIGVLLPCNIIVQEKGNNEVEVAIVNPLVAMQAVEKKSLTTFAIEATEKLKKVLENI